MTEGEIVERVPRRIAILGTAPSTRGDVPWGVPGFEMWSLNDAYMLPGYEAGCHAWFELHSREWYTSGTRPSNHLEKLRELGQRMPVYMWEVEPDIPGSVRYPFEEMCRKYPGPTAFTYVMSQGNQKQTRLKEPKGYLTSSISYMAALALEQLQAGDEIWCWGVDLAADTEYFRQRPNFEYFAGIALGRGIKVYMPEACPLLKGPFYGRPGDGSSREEFIQMLEQEHYKVVNEKRKLEIEIVKKGAQSELFESLKARFPKR